MGTSCLFWLKYLLLYIKRAPLLRLASLSSTFLPLFETFTRAMEKQQIDPRDGESEVAIMGDLPKPIQSETTTHASTSNLPSSSASTSDQNSNDESKPEPTIKQGLISIVKSSWINPLVVFIPFGIASHFVWSPTVTFILNFIAIVPLAKLLGFATEDIALRTGEVNITK